MTDGINIYPDETSMESGARESELVIVNQDELFQRLTDWAYDRVDIDSAVIAETVIDALEQRGEEARLMTDGEILVPGAEDISVIKALVQNILSFFQEDDHDVLVDIRDDLSDLREYLEEQRQPNAVVRPMLTTSFADYTVTEGLLLLILLFLTVQSCVRILRGGFSWLA